MTDCDGGERRGGERERKEEERMRGDKRGIVFFFICLFV